MAAFETWGEARFEPGERFEYSNPGYEVLAIIIERVSGLSYADFLDTAIFDPLRMVTAVVRADPDTQIPGGAIGYDRTPGGWVESEEHWANGLLGAGGVYASLEDLFRWDQALADTTLAGRKALEEAFSPPTLGSGAPGPYGFGWMVTDLIGEPAFHHTGSWVGFRAAIVRFAHERLTVVVLGNSAMADAPGLRHAVARALLN